MLRKGVICIILVLFIINGIGIMSATSCLAQEIVPIDITFETAEDGTLYANKVPIPKEFNLTTDDIVTLVDTLMNDPVNIPKDLSRELYNLVIEISGTLQPLQQ